MSFITVPRFGVGRWKNPGDNVSFCKPSSSLGYRFRVLRTLEKNDMSLDSVTSAEVIGRVIAPRKAVRKETRTTCFAAHLHSEKESGDAHVQINAF